VESHGKDATPNALKDEAHSHLHAILEAPDEDKAPEAVSILEAGLDNAEPVLLLPEKYRKRLGTANSIDRPNEEIMGRERAYVFFQTRNLLSAWIGALLMEQDEKWITGKKYFAWKNTLPGVKVRFLDKHIR